MVMRKAGARWQPLWIAHVPLRCGQSDDLSSCDQILQFRTIRFRFDDRPQVLFQMLHPGESGLNETYAYRLSRGRLETTFSASLPRSAVKVSVEPNGIERRLAVDTFLNRDLPTRYRSFTLKTLFVFGENRFRVASDVLEDVWTRDRTATELAYWGLVHEPGFAAEVEKLRERQSSARRVVPRSRRKSSGTVTPTRRGSASATAGARASASCTSTGRTTAMRTRCSISRLREWEGERTFWEIASFRGQKDTPFECLEEPLLAAA